MRLLDKSQRAPTLKELGLSDAMRDELPAIIARPTGAARHRADRLGQDDDALRGARAINRPEINIITVEDPVEYRLDAASTRCRSTSAPA